MSTTQVQFDEYDEKMVNDSANITFTCPSCNKGTISRSRRARALARPYTCPACGFVGP